MTTFTDQQAIKELNTVLDVARRQGEVRIRAEGGEEFSLRPVTPLRSPLDIPGVNLKLSAEEIVQAVRDGRER